MNILADSSLPGLEQAFPKPFCITKYNHPDELIKLLSGQDILFCRSTLKVNEPLLKNTSIRYVATASSGIDHLDYQWLSAQNIHIIDAKGSNAHAVADYVVACIAYLKQRQLLGGHKIGVIGLGKVGTQVASRLNAMNFEIICFDPLKAQKEATFKSAPLKKLFEADILCIHAQLHHTKPYPSNNLINEEFLAQLKDKCIIINAARGGIVNEMDLYRSKKQFFYCTDVYLNEPYLEQRIIDKALLCTPHIAGHSIEAKYAAVSMVSEKLHHMANLPSPQCEAPQLPRIIDYQKKNWCEAVLEIYNPIHETLYLKKALDKKAAFIHLRKDHRFRHDFCLYFRESILTHTEKIILGVGMCIK